ncbi:hypothetical protein ABZT47_09705 [Sphaerisporangium sp. NPDC005289]|uniref:hypothetical protein n=1 Tax=Sphaerisporangium sp. NPDC005289 TaxID=3155247 RepID=UPI0033BD4122
MYDAIPQPYRDPLRRNHKLIDYIEHFCYTVTTPLTVDEAVRRIGMRRADLVPAPGRETLGEDGCLLIGQVGPAVVTYDEVGAARFMPNAHALGNGCDHGIAQWDFYNLAFAYIRSDGSGGSWDEERRGHEESSEELIAGWRAGPLASYADLFHRYLQDEEAHEEGGDPVYLRAVMLTILELETGVRLDDELIDSLPYALHLPL